MKKNTSGVIAMFALLLSITMTAQKQKDSLPGNSKLPSSKKELLEIANLEKGNYTYSVEDYFEKPKTSGFQFSPDGKYFSYREKDGKGKKHVYVKDTETGKITKAVAEGEELVRGYGWANSNRILYVKDTGGNENYQIYAANVDGSNQKSLTPFENVRAGILEILREQPDYVIIQMNKDNPQVFEPYKANVNTGELEKLFENTDVSSPISGYNFDKDGNLRGYTKQVNGTEYELYYRTGQDQPFEVVTKTGWKDSFGIIGFDYKSENPHDAYVLTNINGNTQKIIRYDLHLKKELETVYENETYDVGGMQRSRKRNYEIDYFHYQGEKRQLIPVSKTYKALHQKFEQQFNGNQFSIASVTDDEDRYLIYLNSDRLYGEYHVYDAKKNSFTKLLSLVPQLKEADMAAMKPISFTSRDGLTISGYLTLPNNTNGKKVPMIVNPHGGPYGVRDHWTFNPEVQLFASRGYATLQVNYRGSGGYGKKFFLAGNNQIGRKMLDDLEDAVAYVIEQGWIDAQKIAVYGGSYGGLATLGSLVKTPDLYVCGVDYVGVSNLFTFYKSFPAYWKPYLKQVFEQWYNPEDEEQAKIMKAVSPALNTEKITKPLFVVQGANDPRVNIDESDQIVTNLRARGVNVPYMVKYDEGHGFHHEKNRISLYKTMMGFFSQYLK